MSVYVRCVFPWLHCSSDFSLITHTHYLITAPNKANHACTCTCMYMYMHVHLVLFCSQIAIVAQSLNLLSTLNKQLFVHVQCIYDCYITSCTCTCTCILGQCVAIVIGEWLKDVAIDFCNCHIFEVLLLSTCTLYIHVYT